MGPLSSRLVRFPFGCFRILSLLLYMLLHFFLFQSCLLLELGDFGCQHGELFILFLLKLGVCHLSSVFGGGANFASLTSVDERLDHARVAREENLTPCCTCNVPDCDSGDHF